MQPMQTLQSGRGGRPAGGKNGSRAHLRRLERGKTAAMKQAGIVKTGHDGHERIEPRAVF